MRPLLGEVLTAHGGLQRWRDIAAITAHGTFSGLLRSRFPGNRMADATVRVKPAQQHTVIDGFPQAGHRAVFDRGDVRIETLDGALIGSRRNARAAFAGISGLRRNVSYDEKRPALADDVQRPGQRAVPTVGASHRPSVWGSLFARR